MQNSSSVFLPSALVVLAIFGLFATMYAVTQKDTLLTSCTAQTGKGDLCAVARICDGGVTRANFAFCAKIATKKVASK